MAADGQRQLSAEPAQMPETGDQVIENDGARVFLAADAATRLDDQVLDATIGEQNRVEFMLAAQG